MLPSLSVIHCEVAPERKPEGDSLRLITIFGGVRDQNDGFAHAVLRGAADWSDRRISATLQGSTIQGRPSQQPSQHGVCRKKGLADRSTLSPSSVMGGRSVPLGDPAPWFRKSNFEGASPSVSIVCALVRFETVARMSVYFAIHMLILSVVCSRLDCSFSLLSRSCGGSFCVRRRMQ